MTATRNGDSDSAATAVFRWHRACSYVKAGETKTMLNKKNSKTVSKVLAAVLVLTVVACGMDGADDLLASREVALGTKAENAKLGDGREAAAANGPSKSQLLEGTKSVTPKGVGIDEWSKQSTVNGGEHMVVPVSEIPNGTLVGTFGAGPCIGVIVYDCHNVYVFHFASGSDDIAGTLTAALKSVGEGARVVVFGGDGTGTSNPALKETLDVLTKDPRLQTPEHANSEGLFVRNGANGQPEVVVRQGIDKPSQQ
ncbi:MAG: hypothetical protein HYY84_19965 [Deltaproteobacteria bacterium]|nr:hypothetical protein [Deltaproteobacteria bacterium]